MIHHKIFNDKLRKAGFKDMDEVKECVKAIEILREGADKLKRLRGLISDEDIESARRAVDELKFAGLPQFLNSEKPEA